ncbi:MAG: YheC/YheD family protein [bacterium]
MSPEKGGKKRWSVCTNGSALRHCNADVAGAALEIASVLDGQLGPFGELGLDLAIDEGGAIWFIEANTKPDKDLVVGLDKIDGIHSQYLSIFEYAGYLCGLKG